MGIGNYEQDGRGQRGRRDLITPHGDRKLADPVARDGRQGAGHLITPHGDRKLQEGVKSAANICSLPLMGIGNFDSPNESYGLDTKLITPHGDRKHSRWADPGQQLQLITPHGDRKPQFRSRRCASRTHWPSLPLMGIGNLHQATLMRPGAYPHYPSWGSETGDPKQGGKVFTGSLPLMGIGNLTRATAFTARIYSHYPSWGSETCGCARRHRGPAPGPAHYPSWGSETLSLGLTASWRHTAVDGHASNIQKSPHLVAIRAPEPQRKGVLASSAALNFTAVTSSFHANRLPVDAYDRRVPPCSV